MSNHYIEEYIYAVDKNNGLCKLAHCYFASMSGAYHSAVYIKDKTYEILSTVYDNDPEITGEKIDIPEIKDWKEMLNGHPNKTVTDLLNLYELKPEFITEIISVAVRGTYLGPYDYCAQMISQNHVHDFKGLANDLFLESKPASDDMWHMTADIVSQNIFQIIGKYR